MRLDEKYRPKTLDRVVGQDKAIALLNRLESGAGLGGRAFWITGKSGTGKTTIAKILAAKIADSQFDAVEIVGRELTAGRLADITGRWIYAGGHSLIVNEAHGLSKPIIEKFLDILESLPDRVVVIFTTTKEGNDLFDEQLDSIPFGSRCIQLSLAMRGITEPMAERLKEIASAENLDGQPIGEYVKLLRRPDIANNMRAALQKIETGEML